MAVWAPAVMTSSSSLSYDVFATWSLNGGQDIQREISERNDKVLGLMEAGRSGENR